MARALGRLSMQRGGPRDLAALACRARGGAGGGARARRAAAAVAGRGSARRWRPIRRWRPPWPRRSLSRRRCGWTTAPPSAPGFDAELDAERGLRDDSRRVLATMQLDYAQRFGVASLKIRHHAQLGYVIEAPAAAVEKLRAEPELTLRQAMANGARFTTADLADLDRRIAEAAERAAARERACSPIWSARRWLRPQALAACAGRAGAAGCRAVGGEPRRGRHAGAARR